MERYLQKHSGRHLHLGLIVHFRMCDFNVLIFQEKVDLKLG